MHIFIDESGIFRLSQESKAWSSVGGVAMPDSSLKDVELALLALKKDHGISPELEFKKERPDCTSKAYDRFINELDELGCTLYVVSTRGGINEESGLRKHKNDTKNAILNYVGKKPDAAEHAGKLIDLIEDLKDQQYNQCILQVELIFDVLNKALSHYSRLYPQDLGNFNWVVDRKEIVEIQYDRVFKEICVGLISSYSITRGLALMFKEDSDYRSFISKYALLGNAGDELSEIKEMYGKNLGAIGKYLNALDLGTLLQDGFNLEDSKASPGLQVADLLVSSVNRCLKQNFDNNEKMAAALGKFMINSRYIDGRALTVMGHGRGGEIGGEAAKLINIMDAASKEVFSEAYRANFSRNFS